MALSAEGTPSSTEGSLSLQEISHLHDRKNELKELHFVYVKHHPELRSLLADFTAALLLEKPANVFAFATEHFASLEASNLGPPMLIHGPPIFVIAGAKRELRLLEKLDQRFPGTFMTPVMTTTRPPHRGERPGITMNFATSDMMEADFKVGKYLEIGLVVPDSEGELIGTTLEAVAHVKARGAIPILQVSYERAAAVRACKMVKPPPRIVFISEHLPPSSKVKTLNTAFDAIIHQSEMSSLFHELAAVIGKYYPSRV